MTQEQINIERERCKLDLSHWEQMCRRVNSGNDVVFNLPEEYIRTILQDREARLVYAVYHLIPNPIKGYITRRKIKWRGLGFQIMTAYNTHDFETLVALPSKSGKRPTYRISLSFDGETFEKYQEWKIKNEEFLRLKQYIHPDLLESWL